MAGDLPLRWALRGVCLIAVLALGAGCAKSRAEEDARRGLALARTGDVTGAMLAFQEALERDPDNLTARYNLGLAFLTHRRGKSAAMHLERFVAARPEDVQGRFDLSRAYLLSGRRDDGIAELQQAVKLGFADHAALVADGVYSPVLREIRFMQLEKTVAQRAGVPSLPIGPGVIDPAAEEKPYEHQQLAIQPLPGTMINRRPCAKGATSSDDGCGPASDEPER